MCLWDCEQMWVCLPLRTSDTSSTATPRWAAPEGAATLSPSANPLQGRGRQPLSLSPWMQNCHTECFHKCEKYHICISGVFFAYREARPVIMEHLLCAGHWLITWHLVSLFIFTEPYMSDNIIFSLQMRKHSYWASKLLHGLTWPAVLSMFSPPFRGGGRGGGGEGAVKRREGAEEHFLKIPTPVFFCSQSFYTLALGCSLGTQTLKIPWVIVMYSQDREPLPSDK